MRFYTQHGKIMCEKLIKTKPDFDKKYKTIIEIATFIHQTHHYNNIFEDFSKIN